MMGDDAVDGPRPVVTLKIALDQNGAVDDLAAVAKRFTSPASLDMVHRLRAACDAVLVGVGTVVRDDPSLTVRRVPLPAGAPQPTRVVIDPALRTPPSAALATDGHRTILVCAHGARAPAALPPAVELLRVGPPPAAELEPFGEAGQTRLQSKQGSGLDVDEILAGLRARGVRELMVEGGPATARRFLEARRVDRCVLVEAPVAFSGQPVPSGISEASLRAAGLRRLGAHARGAPDVTSAWVAGDARWPSPDDISAWP